MPSIDDVAHAWVNHCVRGTNKRDHGSTGEQRGREGGYVTRVSWTGRVIRSHQTPVAKVYGEPGMPDQFALVSSNTHSSSTANQLRTIRSRLNGTHIPVFEVPSIGEFGGWNQDDVRVRGTDDPAFQLVHDTNLSWFEKCWRSSNEHARASWRSLDDEGRYWGWRQQLERAWTPFADYVGHFNLKHPLPRLGEAIDEIVAYRAEKLRVFNLPQNVERRARAAARRLLKKVMLPDEE